MRSRLHTKHDALPLESEGTDRGGIGFAAGKLILDKHFGPTRVEHRLGGVLKEALVSEMWSGPTAMVELLKYLI